MTDPIPPTEDPGTHGITVFWYPIPPDPDAYEAELPSGERIKPVIQAWGKRLGFNQTLPVGTRILYQGKPVYRHVGVPEEGSG